MILNKPSETTVSILGSEWKIIVEPETKSKMYKDVDGWSDYSVKEIHIALRKKDYDDFDSLLAYRKKVVRHELIHAFLDESGLGENAGQYEGAWTKNEEMVDWIAFQFPKIEKVFKELRV